MSELVFASVALKMAEDDTDVARRIVWRLPRHGDALADPPAVFGAEFEAVESHRREIAANHYHYADPWCGNARTFDAKGRYNCGRCNQFEDGKCLMVSAPSVDPSAGSCGDWEGTFAGDAELLLQEKTAETAGYGVAKNGVGFGCLRCPYASAAGAPDSQGRDLWCGKFAARVWATACCVLNGAPLTETSK